MPHSAAALPAASPPLSEVPVAPLRVVDVALFYGERSGGIRTYLRAKRAWAARSGLIEHHLVVPGPRERHEGGRHELPSLRLSGPNGYRLPLGTRALRHTLRAIDPELVLVHDPFWGLRTGARLRSHSGVPVVAVHHATSEMDAAELPGPSRMYLPFLRSCYRRAYSHVDATMSAVDPRPDGADGVIVPLRFGVDPVFGRRPKVRPGRQVLYVGRLARSKGVLELLEAAARSEEPWPLRIVGCGPAGSAVLGAIRRLGLGDRAWMEPFIADRRELARAYARAACVVLPGRYETFGLVALEAAACGAPVVTCSTAPSAACLGPLAHTFEPGDVRGLARAIDGARENRPEPVEAAALAERYSWDRAFEAELSDLRRLL